MTTQKMKAIVSTGYGTPDVLQLREVQKPIPQVKEVLVKIQASSATKADEAMRTGKPYIARLFTGILKPKHPIPGTGFSGVVESVGAEVSNFKSGDRVFGETTLGFSTNAEYVAVPESGVILQMPENMTYADGATYGDGPVTSYNFLKEVGGIQPGQKVLINGASGSLGTAAVQLAKHFGAEVTGVCSTRNVGLVKSLGADRVIDYTKQDFTKGEERYDIIFDTIGKSSYQRSKTVLTENGKFLSPVLQFGLLMQMLWTSKMSKQKAVFAATGMRSDEELRQMMEELVKLFKAGKLKTVIDRQFPLEKLAEAHRYIAAGRKKGNVIINTQS